MMFSESPWENCPEPDSKNGWKRLEKIGPTAMKIEGGFINKLLTRISKDLASHGLGVGAFTYTAAMVSEENIACFDPIPVAVPFYGSSRTIGKMSNEWCA